MAEAPAMPDVIGAQLQQRRPAARSEVGEHLRNIGQLGPALPGARMEAMKQHKSWRRYMVETVRMPVKIFGPIGAVCRVFLVHGKRVVFAAGLADARTEQARELIDVKVRNIAE